MGFEGFPLVIGWELTLACNLRCRHCGSSAALPRVRELTTEEALTICEQLPALLVQEVDFTGGEPLLRPDWHKIAAHLGKLGIPCKLITNGLSLESDMVAQLKDAGIAGVGVSIDGLAATHDYIRNRQGLCLRAIAGIRRTLEADLPVTVVTTVNALNIGELPAMYDFLRSLGIRHWQLQPIFPLGRAGAASELRLSPEQYLQMGSFVKQYSPQALRAGFEILPGDSFGYYTELDERNPAWRGCSAGLVMCGITSDGKVKGCLSMPDELVEGDLRQHDLWDIWFHPASFAYNREFSQNDLGFACQSCHRAAECRGGCSAMSYGATGKLHNDPYCFDGIRHHDRVLSAYDTCKHKETK